MTIRTVELMIMACAVLRAQEMKMDMPGMDMGGMSKSAEYLMGAASGTSRNPDAWKMPMLSTHAGTWDLMGMGQAFIVDTQQSGSRGGDKFYSANWFMGAAQHSFAGGTIAFETMLSLDPATVTERRYPELFQTGETAFGRPIIDGQHPHNFVMSVGVHYARTLGEHSMAELYYAPVGDPALGPVAFPHRASAAELPQAALGHHWQDSSHIASNVATGALKYRMVRLELSGFYGTEPGENRWTIDWGPMNSYSARLSVTPSAHWDAQVSVGRLKHPERQSFGDVVRATSSVSYTRGDWSSSAIWGRNHDTFTKRNLNSYLGESVFSWRSRNLFTGRWELVDKDELSVEGVYRIGAYTAGYTRDFTLIGHLQSGVGFNITAYTLPDSLKPVYGDHPVAASMFLRLRFKAGGDKR